MKEKYIQIGGNFKSGTSLLLSLFDSHPAIASFPVETGHSGWHYPKISRFQANQKKADLMIKLLQEKGKAIESALNKLPSPPANLSPQNHIFNVEQFKTDFNELLKKGADDFWQLNYAFLKAFYQISQPDKLKKAKYWLDKSPLSHLFADKIFQPFRLVKFIHVLREPKNNFASIAVKFVNQKRKRLVLETLLWQYRIWSAHSFYWAKKNLKKFGPENYQIIRFKDLCLKPKETMSRLCRFLNIEELPILYQPTMAGLPFAGNNWEGKSFKGIYTGNVDNWQNRIPPYFAKIMECQDENNLQSFDYQSYFSQKEKKRALKLHQILTTLLSQERLLGSHTPELFIKPAQGLPGLEA